MTEGQVLARRKKTQVKKSNRDKVKSYTDLTPGDLVVHEHHGIGRFIGMERMTVDGTERDFIKIAFAGTDFLYVPATSLDLISKYIGGGDNERVRLNKLGGADWRRKHAPKRLQRSWPRVSSSCMPSAPRSRATPSHRMTRGSVSLRRIFPTTKPTISCAALPRSRTICSPTGRWTACCAATLASARPRSRCVP